ERAAASRLPATPTAAVGDTTRYVLEAPVAVAIPLQGLPKTAADGILTLDVECPAVLAGKDAIFTASVPAPPVTGMTRTHCATDRGTVRITVPGLPANRPTLATVSAVGLPERLVTD